MTLSRTDPFMTLSRTDPFMGCPGRDVVAGGEWEILPQCRELSAAEPQPKVAEKSKMGRLTTKYAKYANGEPEGYKMVGAGFLARRSPGFKVPVVKGRFLRLSYFLAGKQPPDITRHPFHKRTPPSSSLPATASRRQTGPVSGHALGPPLNLPPAPESAEPPPFSPGGRPGGVNVYCSRRDYNPSCWKLGF